MPAKQILPGLYSIAIGAVNAFFIDDPAGGILIDTGFPDKQAVILEALAGLGKQPSDVRHILLTHAHPDHIGGAAALQKVTGATTYAHPIDAPLIRAGKGWPKLTPTPGLLNLLIVKLLVRPAMLVEPATIDRELNDGDLIPLAGGITAIHTPGHRAGQISFLWPQHGGVLFVADAAMNEFGLGLAIAYEDLELGKQSLRKLAALDFQIACFGHGKTISQNASAQFKKIFA